MIDSIENNNIKHIDILTCSQPNKPPIKYLEIYLILKYNNESYLKNEFYEYIELLQDSFFNSNANNEIFFYDLNNNSRNKLYKFNFKNRIESFNDIDNVIQSLVHSHNRTTRYNTSRLYPQVN